jgi:hypothetical protein
MADSVVEADHEGLERKDLEASKIFAGFDRYEYIKVLGSGAYGVVWYGLVRLKGMILAQLIFA